MDTASGNDRARIALLMDCYGKVLTEKQFYAMDLYFQEDLTLSEISEQTGITRQGVWDNIRRGEKQLIELENNLHFIEKMDNIRQGLSEIDRLTKEMQDYAQEKFLSSKIVDRLSKVQSILDKLSE